MSRAVSPGRPGSEALIAGLALAALAGLTAPALLDLVARLGSHIPQPDMPADYLIGWGWGLLLGASILLWPVPSEDRSALLLLWAAKLGVTLGFMLLYEANYAGLDAYSYYLSASIGDDIVRNSGGTRRLLAFTQLHPDGVRSSYHALKVSFAMAGLIGVYFSYRAAVLARGRAQPSLLLLLGLFPSILFWSSIVGKDPVMLLGVGVYAYGLVGWVRSRRAGYLLWLFGGVLACAAVRLWMGPIMLLPVLPMLAPPTASRAVRWGVVVTGVAVAFLLARGFAREMQVDGFVDVLEAAGSVSQGWAVGGSAQRLPFDITTPGGLAAFLPLGVFTALFRPLPLDAHNAFSALAAIENTALLGLCALALVRFRRARLADPVVRWALLFLLTWSGVYGILSYQNLGAAVRFRSQILPVLLLLPLYLAFDRPSEGQRSPLSNGSAPDQRTDDAELDERLR